MRRRLADYFLSLLTAIRFLTVIPLSFGVAEDNRLFQASIFWFPLVGALIGAVAAFAVLVLGRFLPVSVLAVTAIVLSAALSGCLHLDGLADSGDGLLSARGRERILAIMRDSRSGAMGVIALILVLLTKYAALSSLSVSSMATAVFLMPTAGRTAIILHMTVLPYARAEGGLGTLFYSSASRNFAGVAVFFCLAAGLFFSQHVALRLQVAIFFTVTVFSCWCHKKIGGATGDTLGAVCELTECAVALALAFHF